MAEKTLKRLYNYENRVISNGFVKLEKKQTTIKFSDILKNYKTSLVLVDTDGRFIKEAAIELNSIDPESKKLVVGLVDKQTLLKIKDSGVKNGFYRSTSVKVSIGLIILNKNDVFAVFDINNIFAISDKSACKEIFEMVNHIIWSKTEAEYFGTLKEVKDIRLSVIAPNLDKSIIPNMDSSYDYASESLGLNSKIVVIGKPSNIQYDNAVVLSGLSTKMFGTLSKMNLEVFPEAYYPFEFEDGHFDYKSFTNENLRDLVKKTIITGGKEYDVLESDSISNEELVYLDEYDKYNPDFDSVANQYKQYAKELQVSILVKTIKADSSYKPSTRYEIISRTIRQIEEGLSAMEKLLDDKGSKKRIDSIRSERYLPRKVQMFNELVLNEEFGVASLNVKKSPVSTINVNEADLCVPSDIVGKLLVKNGRTFMATSLEHIVDAKKWLAENGVEASLIEE